MGVPYRYRCPHTGGLGQGQHLFLRRFLRSKKRNSAAEKRGRVKIPSPQPPSFLPARAKVFQKSASGFSRKKVRILFRTDSQFVKFWFPASLGASPLASAKEFSSNFQTSQSFSRRRREQSGNFLPAGRQVCPKAFTN